MPHPPITPRSRIPLACCLLGITFLLLPTGDLAAAEPTLGPKRGTLVIVGGGDRNYAVFQQFIELAGGQEAKVVIIPTASSTKPDYPYQESRAALFARSELKMPHVTVVHTHDRAEADTESFVQPIREADAVWFSGGRQWRIADAYLGTLTEKEFRKVLDRGGVIGGSSAGASIQGSFLVRGDTRGSQILIGDHQQGLGYIQNSAIDQHVIPRKRQNGLITILEDPEGRMDPKIDREALLGIGIDEATGIVVRQNVFEVIGKEDGVVLVYDPHTWTEDMVAADKYLTLRRGARYDLEARKVLTPGTPPRPTVDHRAEGYYKDIFMDGGVSLTSRKRLSAAESLGLSYEHYAGKDADQQRELIVGSASDENGVLLYPDGQPRFRLLYVNGGGATAHGKSLEDPGRRNLQTFYENGGSYGGSCAGSFLSGRNTDSKPDPREGYLHIFPYNTLNTGMKKARVGHFIPPSSPLMKYHDFGGDHYVADIYHNNGNWLDPADVRQMEGVEILATYDAPDTKTHEGAAIWAYKKNQATGRIVNIGSHPEGITDGERLALTEACLQYAADGSGKTQIKARLKEGVAHPMDRGTGDKDPLHTRIGDLQYHHFQFEVAPGQWFASVHCETTVDAILDEDGSCFHYQGNTKVLNGVAYSITVSQAPKQPVEKP